MVSPYFPMVSPYLLFPRNSSKCPLWHMPCFDECERQNRRASTKMSKKRLTSRTAGVRYRPTLERGDARKGSGSEEIRRYQKQKGQYFQVFAKSIKG